MTTESLRTIAVLSMFWMPQIALAQGFHAFSNVPGFTEQCVDVSWGEVTSNGCYCPEIESYINPFSAVCPRQMLESSEDLQKRVSLSRSCEPEASMSKYPASKEPAYLVPQTEFCSDLAKYICDPKISFGARNTLEADALYQNMIYEAKHLPSVLSLLKKEAVTSVYQLKPKTQNKALAIINNFLRRKFYTKNRKQIVVTQFENAKKAFLSLLNKQLLSLQKTGNTVKIKNLISTIEIVKNTPLVLGDWPKNDNQVIAYSISAIQFNLGKFDEKPQMGISVRGEILEADRNPQGIYDIFLHEFGHIAQTSYRKQDGEHLENAPIENVMNCLRLPESAAIKKADADCWHKLREKYVLTDKKMAEKLYAIEYYSKVWPDYWANYFYEDYAPKEANCQDGQGDEAVADWYEAEALAERSFPAQARVIEKKNQKFINLKDNPNFEAINSFLGWVCGPFLLEVASGEGAPGHFDSHPMTTDRINRILLAHPVLKESLGCPARSLSQDSSNKDAMYCEFSTSTK